ncbi:MAG: IF-2-associated domain-containing protein, partial [Gammaproteobacteria bacterium]
MADAKISELAEVVGVSVDKLLSQIKEAGLSHTKADDSISNDDKNTLLQFLRRSHGDSEASISAPKKITLKRKTVGTLKAASTHGRGKTVNVEVRKKRTYVKRSAVVEDAPEELEDEAVVAAAGSAEEAAVDSNVEAATDTSSAESVETVTTEAPEKVGDEVPAKDKAAPEVPAEEAATARDDKPGAKRKGQGKKDSDESGEKKKDHLK